MVEIEYLLVVAHLYSSFHFMTVFSWFVKQTSKNFMHENVK